MKYFKYLILTLFTSILLLELSIRLFDSNCYAILPIYFEKEHPFYFVFLDNLLIKNNAIADKSANISNACPESPSINWTNAKIIQTINHTKISIITDFYVIFLGSGIPTLLYPAST